MSGPVTPAFQLTCDLRDGSNVTNWWRGMLTCFGLCGAALTFAPGAATPSPVPAWPAPAEWREFQALRIAPLSQGGETGRRMMPSRAVEPLTAALPPRILETTVELGLGESLAAALIRGGASPGEARRLSEAALAQPLRAGAVLRMTLGPSPKTGGVRPVLGLLIEADLALRLRFERTAKGWTMEPLHIAVDDTPVRLEGAVGGDLRRSILALGVSQAVADDFLRAIRPRMDVSQLSADDRFDLVVEQRIAATGQRETSRLLYASLSRAGAPPLRVMRWSMDEHQAWLSDYRAPTFVTASLGRPVEGRITSPFGNRRHPILGYKRLHKGVDIGAPLGAPIRAVADGRITFAGWKGGYGKQVRIRHGAGLATSYSHMSAIAAAVGSFVRKGQVIGRVGWTGLATGPHLHYEVYRDGAAINPASVTLAAAPASGNRGASDFERALRRLRSTPIRQSAP